MRKSVIVYNKANELAVSLYETMREWLENRGIAASGCDSHSCRTGEADPEAEFAVSIGGDGTFLSCARAVSHRPIPILPIHLGTFGFITEVTQNEWSEMLKLWLDGGLRIEERLVIDVKVWRGEHIAAQFTGVNDCVVSTVGSCKLIRLALSLGGFDAGHFLGDGLLLATPTGSTAYSLAAGGPIMVPNMAAMILTPICPFSLSWRPMVIPDTDQIVIKPDPGQKVDIQIAVDGQESHPLEKHDRVIITGRQGGVKIIKSNKRGFYEVVRSKLGWSGGPYA
ncbi:MAG: hypothetical protein B0D92_08415 [Spirochaeta sp. LUC14_002_19_P3]|nr:MAG: hypothetical protein B0D92_08415 [Spirochaeta sp. LUC14_002_19_P3]